MLPLCNRIEVIRPGWFSTASAKMLFGAGLVLAFFVPHLVWAETQTATFPLQNNHGVTFDRQGIRFSAFGGLIEGPYTWEEMRHHTTAPTLYNETLGVVVGAHHSNPPAAFHVIQRAGLSFDTSAIPAGALIESARLVLTPQAVFNEYPSGSSFVNVYEGSGFSLRPEHVSTDYGKCGAVDDPVPFSESAPVTSLSVGTAHTFTLNVAGLGNIRKSGITKFCLREGHDVDDIPVIEPVPVPWKHSGVLFHSSLASAPEFRPYLEVVYSFTSPDNPPPPSGFGIATIEVPVIPESEAWVSGGNGIQLIGPWQAIREAASGYGVFSGLIIRSAVNVHDSRLTSAGVPSGQFLGFDRAFLSFDTSGIPTGARILDARLTLNIEETYTDYKSEHATVNLYESRQVNTALTKNDYSLCGDAVTPSASLASPLPIGQTSLGEYEFVFSEAGLVHVEPGGTAHLCLRTGYDAEDVPIYDFSPGWRAVGIGFSSSLVADPNLHPRLEITYKEISEPDPVIVIPGILGSWEKNGELVIDPVLHTYDDLINTFVLNGFVEGETIFSFPYEWRFSNTLNAVALRGKINEVQKICECDKVDLVAHSMGGLVARYYIQSGLYENDVDQLVFLATPHLGSVDSYLTWEGGETSQDQSPLSTSRILDFSLSLEARRLGFDSIFDYVKNSSIISIQQLLPTFNYLRDKEIGILREYPNEYPPNTFLEELNAGVSSLLNSGVEITNIVGNTGSSSTISVLRVVDSPELPKWEHGYPENFGDDNTDQGLELGVGDNTVPLPSASFINENLIEVESGHREIVLESQSTIFKILTGKFPDPISVNAPFPNVLLLLKVLSPVDVRIIAPDGKRIGKDFETEGELNEIPGAFYSGFLTDNEYITIPNPLDGEYRIITQGTNGGGEYTIVAGYASDDGLFQNEQTSYTLPDEFEEMTLTINNESPENAEIADTTTITYEMIFDHIEKALALGWVGDDEYANLLSRIAGNSQKLTEKDKPAAVSALLEVFQTELQNGLYIGKINADGFNLLKEDVENLLR